MSSFDSSIPDVPFGSNEVRLSPREWGIALAMLVLVLTCAPQLWERVEPLDPPPNARVPYSLRTDYWMYGRFARRACADDKCLVIGDSVIWGHYVASDETLPAHLNKLADDLPEEWEFANLGVVGLHPAALAGLIDDYGQAISGRTVLLHCNLLWMSDARQDLRERKEFNFHHAALVPQFWPRIPCYAEPMAGRLSTVIGRQVPYFAWARHLQIAYWGNADLPNWTQKHPYENPLSVVRLRLPSPDEPPDPPPVARPWTEAGLEKSSNPWVELEASFQWECFQRVIEILQRRGNRVFVVVGPFNEHLLVEESRQVYRDRLRCVESWLAEHRIPHQLAPLLPSDEYADPSHPLAAGYARMARQLIEDEAFAAFLVER